VYSDVTNKIKSPVGYRMRKCNWNAVCGKQSFLSTESDIKILQSGFDVFYQLVRGSEEFLALINKSSFSEQIRS